MNTLLLTTEHCRVALARRYTIYYASQKGFVFKTCIYRARAWNCIRTYFKLCIWDGFGSIEGIHAVV